jgi:hypothetical protein
MSIPYPIGSLEEFETEAMNIQANEELFSQFLRGLETRQKQYQALADGQAPAETYQLD